MGTQEKLLDVPVSEAQRQAERYADLAATVRDLQEKLKSQAELGVTKLEQIGQRRLSFADEYGVRHTFEVVTAPEKLKYTRKGEPAE